MTATPSELQAIRDRNDREALLAPFKRITQDWGVETTHRFQKRIREINLVATGDLEGDWSVRVVAGDTGVVVGEFAFPEHGRLFDMRRVDYTKPIPPKELKPWIESKIDKRQIRYSTLAEKRGLPLTDPRVIHDLAYRIARSGKYNLKRRRWYNKGKEASLGELYDLLQAAMQETLLAGTKAGLQESTAVS